MVTAGLRLPASGFRLLIFVAACGSSRPKAVEDGRTAQKPEPPRPAAADASVPASGSGDVQVRVEWHDVPTAVRASSGRTACGTALVPAVAPTTTWGIPDAFVVLAGDRGKPAADPRARIVYDRCALAPRAMVAGAGLAVLSNATQPVSLAVRRAFALRDLAATLTEPAKPLLLPIAGHEVDVALDAGYVYELIATPGIDAFVAAAPGAYVAITDASGAAVLRDLPSGTYAVTAWLPPHVGQPARLARGEATVTAGALAEVTLDLGK